MKQVLQSLSNGETKLVDVPLPNFSKSGLLMQTRKSLISAGTERMLVEFGKAGYLDKARQQPEKVKMVLDKMRTDGILTTYDAVKSKLDQPLPLGYCNVGTVDEIGENVKGFSVGDRVISNGPHAQMVSVSHNLTVKIPDNVSDDMAAFVVPASIGLQGLRLAKPTLGESFVVTGLGLIGLLTVQLLRAQGCRVLGIDFDESKLALAESYGAETVSLSKGENPVAAGMSFSRGRGVDGVIITASTKSSDPVSQAARMCRKRGRIVLVGVTGLELNRSEFYEKEISFQVSCSYGPGRYDPSYEDQGYDYPFGYVRWTEQRNFEAILDMMSTGQLDITRLISHRFPFSDALPAYSKLTEDKSALGILLEYEYEYEDEKDDVLHVRKISLLSAQSYDKSKPVCTFIGAGNYASRILIPAFKKGGGQLHTIVSGGGVSASHHGNNNNFEIASTDIASALKEDVVNTVAIVTRHNSHASFVTMALAAGKNVFVEKPLALTKEDLDKIDDAYQKQIKSGNSIRLMVGFNRRFSPHIIKMKKLLSAVKQPKTFIMTMNAGAIPADSWVQDDKIGGGRIIGEACHYVDLMRFLTGSKITSVQARCMGNTSNVEITEDKAAIILGFEDGSLGTIHYYANGSGEFPKERIEVFANEAVLQLDNFRKLRSFGWPNFKGMSSLRQDKGQSACAAAFVESIADGRPCPIPYDEIQEVSKISIEIAEMLRLQN